MRLICLNLTLLLLANLAASAAVPVINNFASPHAQVRAVGLDEVQWTTGFWAAQFASCRNQMLPGMGRLMEGTNYTQFFRNFEIAAGLTEGRYRGAPFNDGDFYKLIEAASAAYAVTHDEFLDRHLDRAITVIAKAQRNDGYIHTPVLVAQRNGDTNAVAFRDRNNFEVYNMGHLFTAACVHHRATGKTNLLAVAIKAADFLEQAFANPSPELARNSICPSHYMGLIELYRETRDARYLELAKSFFAMRDLVARSGDGGDDNQDRVPFLEQTEAVGHAVRANYLFAGAADLFAETGDAATWAMLERVWTNVVAEKLYITGACGALYDGASPDSSKDQKHITRTHQAYGRNYQLPNTTAHNETCANIGNVMWNWRMFLASGEARFMDVAELALYNSVLSGVSLDGTNFFYTNPLRVTDPLPTELRWSRTRVPFVSSFCCPPNLVRTLAELGGYAYGKSSGTIWVNLYGGSTLSTKLPEGTLVKLTQQTEYPWNGRVRITINECGPSPFALKLRIPGWAKGATVRVNLGPVTDTTSPGSYFELRRDWKPGDVVDLDIPMFAQMIEANPLVEETLGQAAVKRGPVVYCLESVDLPPGVRLMDCRVPDGAQFMARYDQRLLGGVVTLNTTLMAGTPGDWSGKLYRELKPQELRPVKVQLIPYFVWGNRGTSEMSVWLRQP
ncbi:MAG: glycoside hydrolase family 127 protein [Verrucomicrobia bacterium]|nr:glycoside hydrolase family 127 protein [Verrucomicrobiota bacterium]